MLQNIVYLGVVVHLFGPWLYLRDTLRGTTRPNRVSFLMWAAAPLIGAVAAFADGVRLPAIPVFLAAFGPLVIFFASLVNKKPTGS